MISKRKIDKIGDQLKRGDKLSQKQIEELQYWRNTFAGPLDYYHQRLKAQIPAQDRLGIARRLKRIESIQLKLKRFSSMRLSTLQDIAGLRVILKGSRELDRACGVIRNAQVKNRLKRLDDYHHYAKVDGYRGIHLVYQSAEDKLLEIQLRTELEHIWATGVETYGVLQAVSFKTGEGEDDWRAFFSLLSSYFAITEECLPLKDHQALNQKQIVSKLKKLIRKLKVIERLNSATAGMDILLTKKGGGRLGKYALLELDSIKQQTSIDVYNRGELEKAIAEYTQRELALKKGSGKNIVLVNMEGLESIQETYPNYFLDTKKLLKILSDIMLFDRIRTS